MQKIAIIDSHTGGEPTRLVTAGFPDLGQGTMAERRDRLSGEFDHYRRTCMLEPRGNDVLVGALLCEPVDPAAAAGVIFFNNTGYLGMCGHGTIGLVRSLAYMGRITPGEHIIETPVGNVTATLHDDLSVSVRNVPSWRYRQAVTLHSETLGEVTGDISWGGNWFFLINDHGLEVTPQNIPALTRYALQVQQELQQQGIFGDQQGIIDHIELFAADPEADSRSFVLCPGGQWDRSPCGTGTSAKLACLAADGKLAAGEEWCQASVIGSRFIASYQPEGDKIIPTLRGTAHICGDTTLLIDDNDPFAWGIV